MKCLKCGNEIQKDSRFCIYCGQEVNQPGNDPEVQQYIKKLENLKQEQADLEKKKQETFQEEQDLKLKLDNYTRLQKGEYKRCRRWRTESSTVQAVQQRENEKNVKRVNSKILFLALSIICCASMFLPWVNVPLLAGIMDYAEVDYPLNFFNMISSLPLIKEGVSGSGWSSGSKLCSILMVDFVLILALIVILLCAYGLCIYAFVRHHSDLHMYPKVKAASLYGIVCAVSTWLICFCTNLWLQNNIGNYYSYVGVSLKVDSGVWLVLIASVAGYVCAKIMEEENEKEKKKYGYVPLEVTNYDPVLPFRAVRLLIRQNFSFTGYSFTANLKVMSFMHQSVDRIEAEVHVITNSGQKFVLPVMTFLKPASGKGNEVVLNGSLYGKQLDCDFNSLREAKLYVRQYWVDRNDSDTEQQNAKANAFLERLEEGSGFSVDSDYATEELKRMRKQYGDSYMKEEGPQEESWMCSCGQLYDHKLKNCPLCGKENQEAEI